VTLDPWFWITSSSPFSFVARASPGEERGCGPAAAASVDRSGGRAAVSARRRSAPSRCRWASRIRDRARPDRGARRWDELTHASSRSSAENLPPKTRSWCSAGRASPEVARSRGSRAEGRLPRDPGASDLRFSEARARRRSFTRFGGRPQSRRPALEDLHQRTEGLGLSGLSDVPGGPGPWSPPQGKRRPGTRRASPVPHRFVAGYFDEEVLLPRLDPELAEFANAVLAARIGMNGPICDEVLRPVGFSGATLLGRARRRATPSVNPRSIGRHTWFPLPQSCSANFAACDGSRRATGATSSNLSKRAAAW